MQQIAEKAIIVKHFGLFDQKLNNWCLWIRSFICDTVKQIDKISGMLNNSLRKPCEARGVWPCKMKDDLLMVDGVSLMWV